MSAVLRFLSLMMTVALLSILSISVFAMTTAERDQKLRNLDQMEKEWTGLKEQWERELADREAKIREYRQKTDTEPRVKEMEKTALDITKEASKGAKDALFRKTPKAAKEGLDASLKMAKWYDLGFEIADIREIEKEYGEKIARQEQSVIALNAGIKVANEVISDSQQKIATLYATPTIPKAPEWLAKIIEAGQQAEKRLQDRKNAEAKARRDQGGSGGGGDEIDRPSPIGPKPGGSGKPTPGPAKPERPKPERPKPERTKPEPKPVGPKIEIRKG